MALMSKTVVTLSCISTLAPTHGTASTAVTVASLGVALPPILTVLATVVVLTFHGIRGTNPGPAGRMLLTLVRLVLGRRGGR
jgi:predicted signal transduction protein with EAL and GGDEF domain